MIRVPRKAIHVVLVLYVLWLVMLSLLPSGKGVLYDWDQGVTWNVQKALHVAAYAVLVVLASMAWLPPHRTGHGGVLLVAVICCIFGGVLEVGQVWIPGRGATFRDTLLNVAGAVVGSVAMMCWLSLSNARRKHQRGEGAAGQEKIG